VPSNVGCLKPSTLKTGCSIHLSWPRALSTFNPIRRGKLLVTEAQLVSVRRALRKLAKTTAIYDMSRHWPDGRQRWAGERFWLRYTIRRMQHENLLSITDVASFDKRLWSHCSTAPGNWVSPTDPMASGRFRVPTFQQHV
jgi:hypothetical protein